MRTIAVVGLGYVGLWLAVTLSKSHRVLGYDIASKRIEELENNFDRNGLVSSEDLANAEVQYVNQVSAIESATFYIISVSTPAHYYELPDLEPLIKATKELAGLLKKGDIVVFESTVYPGATEEICLPLLEEHSHLKCGEDFNIGYSPERINPSDQVHTLKNITKIISAQNEETLSTVREVYQSCCDTVYPVSNIRTAEAVKILENTQRDVNIALMNEFSEIMHAMSIDVHEVIDAAQTKWNFMPYRPGLVGGHCIAVDPLYLAFKAKRLGLKPDLILTARKINDNITHFIIQELNTILLRNNISLNSCKLGIFGITYKADTCDVRNTLALKLIKELKISGFNYEVNDPLADKQVIKEKCNIELKDFDELNDITIAIILVGHHFYHDMGLNQFLDKLGDKKIIMDIPNLFVEEAGTKEQLNYWKL